MARRAQKTDSRRALNRWTAHAMPVVLTAIVAWATWVFAVLVCINHLLLGQKRRPAAIVLLVLYFILLLGLATAYLRTVITINVTPGFVPKGALAAHSEKEDESITTPQQDGDGDGTSDVETGFGSARGRRESLQSLGVAGNGAWAGPSGADHISEAGDSQEDPEDDDDGDVYSNRFSATEALRTANSGSEARFSMTEALHGEPAVDAEPRNRGVPNGSVRAGVGNATVDGPATASTTNINLPVPKAPRSMRSLNPRHTRKSRSISGESHVTQGTAYSTYYPMRPAASVTPGNLNTFTSKDAFVCENDGKPRWCQHCNCWKPDRSHHCSEVGRCLYRMDHFCPWVGGVVAETSYKYFFQAVSWASAYCIFLVVALAVMVAEQGGISGGVNGNWIGLLAVASLFALFAGGMTGSTLQMMARNISTIDQLSWRTKVYQIAIHDPAPPPPSLLAATGSSLDGRLRVWHGDRCYVIVNTQPGENPWALPRRRDNIKQVLGERWWLWWLPLGRSPFRRRDRTEGLYEWNPVLFARLKKEAGIAS